jgi:hypothetical protein
LNHARNFSRSRLTLLMALLAVFAAILSWLPQPAMAVATPASLPQPTAMATCLDAVSQDYYSDATYTVKIGNCYHYCCATHFTCTGQYSNYYKIAWERSCDFT